MFLRRKSERPSRAADGARIPFQLKKHTDRCFIQVQMEPSKPEARAVLFVPEAGAKPELFEDPRPSSRLFYRSFGLQAHFEKQLVRKARTSRWRSFRRQNGSSRPAT